MTDDLVETGSRIRLMQRQGMTAEEIAAVFAEEAAAPAPAGGDQPAALTRAGLAAMSRDDQRRAVAERWDEVVAALSGRRLPGQPLTPQELRDLAATLKRSPEVAGDPDRWSEITGELARRGGAR